MPDAADLLALEVEELAGVLMAHLDVEGVANSLIYQNGLISDRFEASLEVEVAVREAGNFGPDEYGTELMHTAFRPKARAAALGATKPGEYFVFNQLSLLNESIKVERHRGGGSRRCGSTECKNGRNIMINARDVREPEDEGLPEEDEEVDNENDDLESEEGDEEELDELDEEEGDD